MRRLTKVTTLLLAALMALSLTACGDKTGYPKDGFAYGAIGDAMHTSFFDFTINSAELTDEFDGYTPADGYELLVAEISIVNTTKSSQPMFFYDFQVQWNSFEGENDDEAFGYPVVLEEGEDYVNVSDQQLPVTYDLKIKETREGILLYEVPTGRENFSIAFMEYFEDESVGDTFFVEFTL